MCYHCHIFQNVTKRIISFFRIDIYQKHPTDLDASKLVGGELDANYVLSSRVRTGRSIAGLALPPKCDRAERREVYDHDCFISSIVSEYLSTFGLRVCDLTGRENTG